MGIVGNSEVWMTVALSALAFFVSLVAYPPVIRIARRYHVYDNPNLRKLQRNPVPVLGGVAVFVGIVAASVIEITCFHYTFVGYALVAMSIMMFTGLVDDIWDIPANLRFIFEIIIIWLLMILSDNYIDDFHGVWGIGEVTFWWSMPLSIVSGVGIMNSINLMDGVDGYSSGFCILACSLLSVPLFLVGDVPVACFSLVCASALLPFFLHNVFGSSSKMFIGDSGTLMMGTALAAIIFRILSSNSPCDALEHTHNIGLFAYTLGIMCIPVFDTVRVMFARMLNNKSPFDPDKTHLHHLFIEMGFSHVGTAVSILCVDLFVVLLWWLAWKLGASISVQLYVVLGMGVLTTSGFYNLMKRGQRKNSSIYRAFCRLGALTHIEKEKEWKYIGKITDKIG